MIFRTNTRKSSTIGTPSSANDTTSRAKLKELPTSKANYARIISKVSSPQASNQQFAICSGGPNADLHRQVNATALNGYVLQRHQTPKQNRAGSSDRFESLRGSKSNLLSLLLLSADLCLMAAGLTKLIRTDPFSFYGPRPEAFVFRIVARKVAMLYQATASVIAAEMDDLEL